MKPASKQMLNIKSVEEKIKGFFRDDRIVKKCNCCGGMHTFKNLRQVQRMASYVSIKRHTGNKMHSFDCTHCETPLYFKEKE